MSGRQFDALGEGEDDIETESILFEPESDLRDKIWAFIGVTVIFSTGTLIGILIGWGLNR